jgi:hypothetical protein
VKRNGPVFITNIDARTKSHQNLYNLEVFQASRDMQGGFAITSFCIHIYLLAVPSTVESLECAGWQWPNNQGISLVTLYIDIWTRRDEEISKGSGDV